ncbi:MAG: hypothetical protein GY953_13590, partial [bacterium]|nr:hypothetical protein [bacterium]
MPRSGLAAALHVFGLANLAVAEPLFNLLSRQAEFLIAHDTQPLDLVLIVLLLSVALPVSLLVLTRAVAWLLPPAERWVHLAQVTGLAGLIMLRLANRLAPSAAGGLSITAAVVMVVVTGVCYLRWNAVRTFFTFVSAAKTEYKTLWWMRPHEPKKQNLYRKGTLEFAENMWTHIEASGSSLPYWRRTDVWKKYSVLI